MKRKPNRAGMVDVSSEEGGEPPMSDTGGDPSAGVTSTYSDDDSSLGDTGSTTGAQSLQLEIDILSADAVDRVAEEIARRVAIKATAEKIRCVAVAGPAVAAALRLHSAVEAEVAGLEALAAKVAASARSSDDIVPSDVTAFAVPVVAAAAEGVRQVVGSAASALRNLAMTTSYSGRSKVARDILLTASLAKHLARHKLEVELPEQGLAALRPGSLLGRIMKLQDRCRQLQEHSSDPQAETLAESVDTLAALVFARGDDRRADATIAQQIILADGLSTARKGSAVLFVEIVFSGGSYRTRKWIFNFLFGKDGLTYSGGAGVTFFLFRANERSTLDSDTIYFASPHGSFADRADGPLRSSNIST